MTFFLHIKGQAASGVMVQRSVCLEMSASLCLSCVCPPGESHTWNTRSASPTPSYVVLCSKLSVYFLTGIIFFFLTVLRRNQLKLSKSPVLKKSPRSEPFSRRSCEQERRRAGSGSPRTSCITSVTKREKFKNKSHLMCIRQMYFIWIWSPVFYCVFFNGLNHSNLSGLSSFQSFVYCNDSIAFFFKREKRKFSGAAERDPRGACVYAAAKALFAEVPTEGKFRHRKSSYFLWGNLRVSRKASWKWNAKLLWQCFLICTSPNKNKWNAQCIHYSANRFSTLKLNKYVNRLFKEVRSDLLALLENLPLKPSRAPLGGKELRLSL